MQQSTSDEITTVAKKKQNKWNAPVGGPPGPGFPGGPSSDKMMADLRHLLSQHNFESPEEVDRFLSEMLMSSGGFIPERTPRTPLEEAQDVMYEAWDSPRLKQRLTLARKALEISPDCADAYVLLAAESTDSLEEARALYEQGVAAGQRAIGPDFKRFKGDFWGYIETRPYMRARHGLAITLWHLGDLEAAASHMDAMLELNPSDNQGVRLLYCILLLEMDNRSRLERLLKRYRSDWSPAMKYSAALLEFRKNGKGSRADKLLLEAFNVNSHVPAFLLGRKKPPKSLPEFYSPGDQTEAADYVVDGIRSWTNTEGALDWLREVTDGLFTP